MIGLFKDVLQVVEYQLPHPTNIPSAPCLIFIVDTCLESKELEHLKASLSEAIAKLPEDTMIGLVSFGTMVHVHELGRSTYNKSTVFDGRNQYTFGEIIRSKESIYSFVCVRVCV